MADDAQALAEAAALAGPASEALHGPAPTPLDSVGVGFARFYEQHMAHVIRHLMRQGASPHEAADAAQAAFTEAFPQWDRIQHPAAWLRVVAVRAFLRRPVGEVLTDVVPDQPSQDDGGPLGAVELGEQELRVLAALATLPPQQRAVMAWHLDDFSHTEIGAALEMTPQAVRQNLSRARARLRAILLNEDGGGR